MEYIYTHVMESYKSMTSSEVTNTCKDHFANRGEVSYVIEEKGGWVRLLGIRWVSVVGVANEAQ